MAHDTELDRNEAATPYKLAEARKRGQAAKSPDVVSALVFAAAVVWLYASGFDAMRAQFTFDRALLARAAESTATARDLWELVAAGIVGLLHGVLPFAAVCMAAGIAGNVAQTGVLLSTHPITPDWTRLHPMTGLKRLFSLRTLFDAARACAKLAALTLVLWLALGALLPALLRTAALPPMAQASTLVEAVARVGLQIALVLALIAAIDLAWTRREFSKRLRMSRREVKDEHKHREGDPRVRARLRSLRRELLERTRALARTRDADVLVTNPTHYAVALRYRHGEMAAPRLVAKGAGQMAWAMRKLAARHRIPVVQNRRLARALYAEAALEHEIPTHHYAQVARLMVWLMALRNGAAAMQKATQASTRTSTRRATP